MDKAKPEIEKKFLIRLDNLDEIKSKYDYSLFDIYQTYLYSNKPDEERRIRQKTQYFDPHWSEEDRDTEYYFTTKTGTGFIRVEEEIKLNKEMYDLLKDFSISDTFHKRRYSIKYLGLTYEIDVYDWWIGVGIMEVELSSELEYPVLPPEIVVIADVTNDSRFSNYSLSFNPCIEMADIMEESGYYRRIKCSN